jgi:Fur family ferric uptake transcriptional regulator
MKHTSLVTKAEQLIRESGDRSTPSRVRVFSLLLAKKSPVTHHQIEADLDRSGKIDRVTLYRVLDWLTEKGLVHKVVSDDRVWRFRINQSDTASHQHAHFKCTQCAKVICLEDVHADIGTPVLPAGYHRTETELTVKGICAECT